MLDESDPEAADAVTAALSDDIVEAFEDAQLRTIGVLRAARDGLRDGMTEKDVVDLIESLAAQAGFTEWFRPPYVHFDCPVKPAFIPSGRVSLKPGTVVEMDACPATDQAYGVFGTVVVHGGRPEPELVTHAREACRAASGFASRWKCTGEVFVYAQAWANNRRGTIDSDSVGHVCFPRLGRTAIAWPRAARAATLMRRHRVQWFNPRRMNGFYAIQPRVVLDGHGCAFEEMILINGDEKRIVGRPGGLAEVGTL